MRSALNVSPFCRMIGEALTSAPAVMSLAKARRVYADDQLFAAPAIRLAGPALFRHLPVVWSVLRFAFSVVGIAFSRDCDCGKGTGPQQCGESTTRFLHVDFPKCRCRRFRLLVQRSVVCTHEVPEREEIVIDQLWSRRSCEVAWL